MAKLTVQVRTNDDLLQLLSANESAAWVIAQGKESDITHVQIVNFNGTQMIEGIFDRNESLRNANGRLVLRFMDGRIVNSAVTFDGQNPVRYIEG
jgi:hypothetical protein